MAPPEMPDMRNKAKGLQQYRVQPSHCLHQQCESKPPCNLQITHRSANYKSASASASATSAAMKLLFA
jgi:hypothetical protein